MIVPVLWCSRHDEILARGYADQGFLEAILDRTVWSPPDSVTFEHHEVRGDFPDVPGALVAINCRTHASPADVSWFKSQLDRLEWAVVLLCGDEEWVFPWQEIPETDSRKVWVMQARPEHQGLSGFLPGGWYPGTRDFIAACDPTPRPIDWFFGGQINHSRRKACIEVLRDLPRGMRVETDRYLQEKIPKAVYFESMTAAKVIPCPSGPYSVDCARTFEALEAGCIPVADTVTARAGAFDYWELLFRCSPPFPRITDWADFPEILSTQLDGWISRSNRVFAWWQQQKRRMARQLDNDIRSVAQAPVADRLAVIVTSSPVPLHPSTEHLERTITSIRDQLPTAEIVLVFDGVRPEQDDRRSDYDEYIRAALWRCNFEWTNVVPVVLPEWQHQANATRAALEFVEAPLVLFVEHDTPLVGEIDWDGLCELANSGEADAIQLLENQAIHPDHESVMVDHITRPGVPVRRTAAWWQRPHLAKTSLYRDRIMPLFSETSRSMIEDALYPIVWSDYTAHGWGNWKLWAYTPEGGMRRSGHLDSRGDDLKYEMWL